MSRMYTRIPVQNMQRGERLVYDAMAQLPADWVVFHSCKEDYLEEGRYIHYEADFVVLIPGKGLLVIEVKDWPEVRLENGRWQSRKSAGSPWKVHHHSPLEQANIALQKMMRSLAGCGCIPRAPQRWPEHRHMAILTCSPGQEQATHHLPLHSLILCGRESLTHLRQHIEQVFVLQQPERMSAQRMQKISEALLPSVHFRMSLDTYMLEMDKAAANLLDLLPALQASTGGIRIEGCAGSGKTVMACAEAARLAAGLPRDNAPRVLMLCFNHALAAELRQHPQLCEQEEQILVSTFHDFCICHILAPHQLEHLVNYDNDGERLPDAALEAISGIVPHLPHYDYIFVDEAQDFRAAWWQIIRSLLKEKGRLYLFADEYQDLYNRYHQLPELPTRLKLSTNLRNARQIAVFSRSMLPPAGQQSSILPMCGADIQISSAADTPEERAAELTRIISKLTSGPMPARPCDIVVLSPWRTSHPRCSLNLVPALATAPPDESPDEAARRRNSCRQAGASRIFASTIKSFKGQEATYIIVTDVIGLGESRGFDMKELYTACTRARYGLFIIPTTSGKELLETIPLFSPAS